jgi:hypothetical protein
MACCGKKNSNIPINALAKSFGSKRPPVIDRAKVATGRQNYTSRLDKHRL